MVILIFRMPYYNERRRVELEYLSYIINNMNLSVSIYSGISLRFKLPSSSVFAPMKPPDLVHGQPLILTLTCPMLIKASALSS